MYSESSELATQVVSLSSLQVVSDSAALWTATCQASLSFTISPNLLKVMSTGC